MLNPSELRPCRDISVNISESVLDGECPFPRVYYVDLHTLFIAAGRDERFVYRPPRSSGVKSRTESRDHSPRRRYAARAPPPRALPPALRSLHFAENLITSKYIICIYAKRERSPLSERSR